MVLRVGPSVSPKGVDQPAIVSEQHHPRQSECNNTGYLFHAISPWNTEPIISVIYSFLSDTSVIVCTILFLIIL